MACIDCNVFICSLIDRYLGGFHTLLGEHLASKDCPCMCVLGQMWGIEIVGPEGCASSNLRAPFHLSSEMVVPVDTLTIS